MVARPAIYRPADDQDTECCSAGIDNYSARPRFQRTWAPEDLKYDYDRCLRPLNHRGHHYLTTGLLVDRHGNVLDDPEVHEAFWSYMHRKLIYCGSGWCVYNDITFQQTYGD